jgi:hypothetical protein
MDVPTNDSPKSIAIRKQLAEVVGVSDLPTRCARFIHQPSWHRRPLIGNNAREYRYFGDIGMTA